MMYFIVGMVCFYAGMIVMSMAQISKSDYSE